MERDEIQQKVSITSFESRYKRTRLSIHLKVPLTRETLTETALLPYLLERGCKAYPDMTVLKRRLNVLYGANITVKTTMVDYARVISFIIEGVDKRYLKDETIDIARADLLLGILFDPCITDEAFDDSWVDIEREKLRQQILSEINDKRIYCLNKASELFFGEDVRGLPQFGYIEDLDAIDGKRLYTVYKEILQTASVEIISIGYDSDVKERIRTAFSLVDRNPLELQPKKAVDYSEEKKSELLFDVEQDKYAMILTAGRLLTDYEQSVFRLANAIFGASPTSRLFMNVREKKSLCYYCASRPGFITGALTIDSGVEYEDVTALREAVLNELEDMANGNISDEEQQTAKLMLTNVLTSLHDTIEGIAGWYLNSIYRLGRTVTPDEEIETIYNISKDDISSLMKLFKVSVSVLLHGEDV